MHREAERLQRHKSQVTGRLPKAFAPLRGGEGLRPAPPRLREAPVRASAAITRRRPPLWAGVCGQSLEPTVLLSWTWFIFLLAYGMMRVKTEPS